MKTTSIWKKKKKGEKLNSWRMLTFWYWINRSGSEYKYARPCSEKCWFENSGLQSIHSSSGIVRYSETVHPIMMLSINRSNYVLLLNTFLEHFMGLSIFLLILPNKNSLFLAVIQTPESAVLYGKYAKKWILPHEVVYNRKKTFGWFLVLNRFLSD